MVIYLDKSGIKKGMLYLVDSDFERTSMDRIVMTIKFKSHEKIDVNVFFDATIRINENFYNDYM